MESAREHAKYQKRISNINKLTSAGCVYQLSTPWLVRVHFKDLFILRDTHTAPIATRPAGSQEKRKTSRGFHGSGHCSGVGPVQGIAQFHKSGVAQGRTQLNDKVAEGRNPMFGATGALITPRAGCAALFALCCAVCVLAMSRSDRQYGCNLRKKKMSRTERGQIKEKKDEYTRTTYRYLVLHMIPSLVLLCVRKKAERSTAQHRIAGRGTAPHGTARPCAALLS